MYGAWQQAAYVLFIVYIGVVISDMVRSDYQSCSLLIKYYCVLQFPLHFCVLRALFRKLACMHAADLLHRLGLAARPPETPERQAPAEELS